MYFLYHQTLPPQLLVFVLPHLFFIPMIAQFQSIWIFPFDANFPLSIVFTYYRNFRFLLINLHIYLSRCFHIDLPISLRRLLQLYTLVLYFIWCNFLIRIFYCLLVFFLGTPKNKVYSQRCIYVVMVLKISQLRNCSLVCTCRIDKMLFSTKTKHARTSWILCEIADKTKH